MTSMAEQFAEMQRQLQKVCEERDTMRAERDRALEANRQEVCLFGGGGGGGGNRHPRPVVDSDASSDTDDGSDSEANERTRSKRKKRKKKIDPVVHPHPQPPTDWDMTEEACRLRLPEDDPRKLLDNPAKIQYPVWNPHVQEPQGYKYSRHTLSWNFHPWTDQLARIAWELQDLVYVKHAKATKAPANLTDPIQDSRLSEALPGNDKPKYMALRFLQTPPDDHAKNAVTAIVSNAQEMKTAEMAADAIFRTVFLGQPYVIFVQDHGGKSVHTNAFKNEVEDMKKLVRTAIRKNGIAPRDESMFLPNVYCYSENRNVPKFAVDPRSESIRVKTDQSNGEYLPVQLYRYKGDCAPILIVCTNSGNIDRFMLGNHGTDTSILSSMNAPMSFFKMMGALNGPVGGVITTFDTDETDEPKTVEMSTYAPTCNDESRLYDSGRNRPVGTLAGGMDEADLLFGSRTSRFATEFLLDDSSDDVLSTNEKNLLQCFSSMILVTATPADIILPFKKLSHFVVHAHRIDMSANWIGPAFENCPDTDPHDASRTYVLINGDVLPDQAKYLAPRNDSSSKKLSMTDTADIVQKGLLLDGTWNAQYPGYQPMQRDARGRIPLASYLRTFADDGNAPYASIAEAAKTVQFTASLEHQSREVMNRLQVVPGGMDPIGMHRSLLVLNEHTQKFPSQLTTLFEMVKCGSATTNTVVFTGLIIEHGIVYVIKETGHIDIKSFAIGVHAAACNADGSRPTTPQAATSLARCALKTVADRHRADELVDVGDGFSLYRHVVVQPAIYGGNDTTTPVLYFWFPNSTKKEQPAAAAAAAAAVPVADAPPHQKAANVVDTNFQLLVEMSALNRSGRWFKSTSDSRVIKLVTIGGQIFGRGTRCKDSAHKFHLTDIWPAFYCSDRKVMNEYARKCLQGWGRINTVLLRQMMAFIVANGLVPSIHCDEANFWFFKLWTLASRQLVKAASYLSDEGVSMEGLARIINDPPEDAGTDFSELATCLSKSIGQGRSRTGVKDLRAYLTSLLTDEAECAAELSESANLDRSRIVVPELVAQHTAARVPGLADDVVHLTFTAIPNKTKAIRLIEKLQSARSDAAELAKPAWGTTISNPTKIDYVARVINNLRIGRIYFQGEPLCALDVQNGTPVMVDETEPELGPVVIHLTDAQRAALNRGTVSNPAGTQNNKSSAAYVKVMHYIHEEIANGNYTF